jgi:hypothetical protein
LPGIINGDFDTTMAFCGRAVEDDPEQPGLRVMIVCFTR